MPAVEAIQLTRTFGPKIAVDHLDLAVDEGEFYGFLGPNGAGKSTTIKMLVGLLRPTAGQARIAGIDMWQQPLQAKQLIGVLPEGLALYERLTAREFVRFVGVMYGLSTEDAARRTDELLDLMDLDADADKLIVDYSQGMRKKTALALALLHNPKVLFLDEPFEGIDPVTSKTIRDLLHALAQRSVTVFFTSHILSIVERLATHYILIRQGRVVWNSEAAALPSTLEEMYFELVEAPRTEELEWLGSRRS